MSTPRPSSLVERDIDEAERVMAAGAEERPRILKALAATLVLHAILLWGRLPGWGAEPRRVDAPQQMMKVQFLRPPAPPAAAPKPPEPEKKKIARPDTTPDEPEPEIAPPAPPAEPEGPLRVTSGQGPGVIKRVEPIYPPIARTARIEGQVVLDAIVQKDGSVGEIVVLKSANPILERSAVEALRQWRFTPGHHVIMTLTVNFILK
jgi:TonB family protein